MLGLVNPFADALNAFLYAAEGDYGNATLVALGLVPVGGDAFGLGRVLFKGSRTFEDLHGFKMSNTLWSKILRSHVAGEVANKSLFDTALGREGIQDLVRASKGSLFISTTDRAGNVNYATLVDAGRVIGVDHAGRPTTLYSVIVDVRGTVQTVHPGMFIYRAPP